MQNLKSALTLTIASILTLSANPAFAIDLSDSDKDFCKQTNSRYTASASDYYTKQSANSENFGGEGSYGIFSASADYGSSNSSSVDSGSASDTYSKYSELDCDTYIKTVGMVTVAELESGAYVAVTEINAKVANYGVDGAVRIAELQGKTAEEVAKIRADAEIHASDNKTKVDALKVGADVVIKILDIGSEGKKTAAEIEIARIQAERDIRIAELELEKARAEEAEALEAASFTKLTLTNAGSSVLKVEIMNTDSLANLVSSVAPNGEIIFQKLAAGTYIIIANDAKTGEQTYAVRVDIPLNSGEIQVDIY